MEHYISKSALVAEIKRLAEVKPIDEFQPQVQNKIDWLSGKLFAINSLRVFLDTLEVKEVDFDDFGFYWGEYVSNLGGDINNYEVAKYFYELGLKAQKEE